MSSSPRFSFSPNFIFLLMLLSLHYGCASVEQTSQTVKKTAEAPFHLTKDMMDVKKMPNIPKEIFDLGKAPIDLARSFAHVGWEEQFSSVGDRRGKGYSSQGLHFMANGNFEQAVHYFQLAADRDPKNASYLSLLAWSYFKLNQYDKALEIFDKIKNLDHSILDAYTGPGWIHFKTGQFDQAIQDFEAALKVNPNSSEAFAGLGWCYFRKNDIPTATTYLNIALRKGMKNPSGTEPEAHRALGYLYFSQGNFREALKHFKIATRHMPDWNDARIKWADSLFALGKHHDSIRVYHYALCRQKTAEIYDKLGWAYFYAKPCPFFGHQKRNLEKARVLFDKALAIDPNDTSAQTGLKAVQDKLSGVSQN